MSGALAVFRFEGKLDRLLLACFLAISALLLFNALLHDPTTGYDAQDHLHYVQALATHGHLPVKSESGQFYSPPLPYLLPALITGLQLGLWKALKLAQLFEFLLGAATLFYLLKICEIASPGNRRLKLLCLGLLGVLPVFYRSFALIRGEPYLAFLSVFAAHESLMVLVHQRASALHITLLGISLGLAILARQWGFFLFPAVLVLAFCAARNARRAQPLALAFAAVVIALLVGGWFYILMLRQYGTLTAFDRAPQSLSATNLSGLLGMDASSAKVFADPVRPSLGGRLFPILYADTWGDYWGYFVVYARNGANGDFQDGVFFQGITSTAALPPGFVTDRFEVNHYLGVLGILALLPTVLLLCGLAYGCIELGKLLLGRVSDSLGSAMAFFAMIAGSTLLGFLWFVLRYQSVQQAGDLVKATYLLQAFPALAFLAAGFIDHSWVRHPHGWSIIAVLLPGIFALGIPAFVTHYVHLVTTPGLIGLLVSTLIFVLGLWITYWIHSYQHLDIVVQPAAAPKQGPLISFCVPARNEADNIRPCIEALLAQSYPAFEVIVLDDRSTDATPRILAELSVDARLRVLHGAELPAGWAGKPHALVQAAAVARGEWLCFVDADTFLTPDALAACYQQAVATSADLFTIMTRQVMGTFWEKAVMPLVMTALSVGFPASEVNDPTTRNAIANGQFILIRRSVYDAVGGHERIKNEIVEDKALAELVKWNGYRLIVAEGQLVARTRMYTSLAQMWEGWTKNIYLGLRAQPGLAVLGAFGGLVLVVAALFMPVWPVLGLLWFLRGGGPLALLVIAEAVVLWAAVLYARAAVARGMGLSPMYALTTPLGAGVFAAMMLASAWKIVSGRGVTWRGRRYKAA